MNAFQLDKDAEAMQEFVRTAGWKVYADWLENRIASALALMRRAEPNELPELRQRWVTLLEAAELPQTIIGRARAARKETA